MTPENHAVDPGIDPIWMDEEIMKIPLVDLCKMTRVYLDLMRHPSRVIVPGWNFNMDEAPRHQTDDQPRIRILATDGVEVFSCRWTYRFSAHFEDTSPGWYSDVSKDRVHPIAWKNLDWNNLPAAPNQQEK